MMQQPSIRPATDSTDLFALLLRLTGGGLTVGLLIVLPALKILGLV